MFENCSWPVSNRNISNDVILTYSSDKSLSFKQLLDSFPFTEENSRMDQGWRKFYLHFLNWELAVSFFLNQ